MFCSFNRCVIFLIGALIGRLSGWGIIINLAVGHGHSHTNIIIEGRYNTMVTKVNLPSFINHNTTHHHLFTRRRITSNSNRQHTEAYIPKRLPSTHKSDMFNNVPALPIRHLSSELKEIADITRSTQCNGAVIAIIMVQWKDSTHF